MLSRLKKSYLKNKVEIASLLSGRLPAFVYGVRKFRDIPVFCFHSAQYPEFEMQLNFLKINGYRTLDACELHERLCDDAYRNEGKEIVLTFDDGMASVWTVAFPFLQKYELKIISFILPGLIVEGGGPGPTIEGADEDEAAVLATRDYSEEPLCNWQEIRIMHQSGLVDFQSHGLHHALVAVSPKVVDFIHPGFDAYHYGNIHIPLYTDDQGRETRDWVLGHPVYESAPRLAGRRRYLDPYALRAACAEHIASCGGVSCFDGKDWRRDLNRIVATFQRDHEVECGRYESDEQMTRALWVELVDSKRLIEERLKKAVNHFCFPWFAPSEQAAALATGAGYRSLHLGAAAGFRRVGGKSYPLLVNRLQEEYLGVLPGRGRISLLRAFQHKVFR